MAWMVVLGREGRGRVTKNSWASIWLHDMSLKILFLISWICPGIRPYRVQDILTKSFVEGVLTIQCVADAGSLVGSQIDENILKFATDPARNTAFIPPPPPLPPPQSEETNQTRELFGANRSSKRPRELDSDNTFAVDKAIAEALQLEYSKIANSIRDNPGSEDHNSGVQRLREQVCILNARLARRSRCIVCMDNSVDVGFLHKDRWVSRETSLPCNDI